MKLGIVAQKGNIRALSLVEDIRIELRDTDVDIVADEVTAQALSEDRNQRYGDVPREELEPPEGISIDNIDTCDLVVSIGGDGTFLYAARGTAGTPIMGVNLGEVGFLNAVASEDAIEHIRDVVGDIQETGVTPTHDLSRLQAQSEGWELPPSLNEIVIQGPQRGHGNGAGISVRVNGDLYTSGHADGVLIGTPTGSTAYNLSEGGPLVHPDADVFVVTEMAGKRPMPPVVIPQEARITVHVEDAETASVVSDGRTIEEVTPPTSVTIERADHPVRVAGPPLEFFPALNKLE